MKAIFRAIRIGLQLLIILYGVLLTALLLVRAEFGERWSAIAFANNFLAWLLLLGMLLGVVALFSRWRLLVASTQFPAFIAFAVLYGPLLWPPGSVDKPADGVDLTIATYNVLSAESDPDDMLDVIEDLDADIIGLQELEVAHADLIERELSEEYPYRSLHGSPSEHGVGLLSRYRIVEESEYYDFIKYVRHLRAVVDVEGMLVTVYLAHPHTPSNYYSPMRYSADFRDEQLKALRNSVRADSGPVLVLCDCNLSDQSEAYRDLDRLLDDTYREVGWGMGFTFPSRFAPADGWILPRMMRLDYIWHSAHFTAYDVEVWRETGGSDHRPVLARLVLESAP
ncbi:MAG: hypothetical protein GYB65_03855 [Chloroflexi bacterium]|nr:hypothetical protein [Chloroflexota bacterium]